MLELGQAGQAKRKEAQKAQNSVQGFAPFAPLYGELVLRFSYKTSATASQT
jgi:hypothetical protein